jgi:hypothetical protein
MKEYKKTSTTMKKDIARQRGNMSETNEYEYYK